MLTQPLSLRNQPFALLAGGRDYPKSLRRLSPAHWRCRPGESPVWIRLRIDVKEGDLLREFASIANVPVDAWLAVMLDFRWALSLLTCSLGCESVARVALESRVRQTPVRLAATPALRSWQRSLARGRGLNLGSDELPEVVLPTRVAARLRTLDAAAALASGADWPLARESELRASGLGESLERFAVGFPGS